MAMQPQTPQAPPPIVPAPNGPNQYDFIFSPHKPKKSLLPGGVRSNRIIIMIIGGAVLLLVMLMVAALLFGGNDSTPRLTTIANQQEELVRVADIGAAKAKGAEAQNLGITASLSLKSDQAALLDTMGRSKPSAKVLTTDKNSQTDEQLTRAEQANRFDEVFIATMKKGLEDYQKTLQSAFDETESQTTRQLLAAQYQHASTLLGKNLPRRY